MWLGDRDVWRYPPSLGLKPFNRKLVKLKPCLSSKAELWRVWRARDPKFAKAKTWAWSPMPEAGFLMAVVLSMPGSIVKPINNSTEGQE